MAVVTTTPGQRLGKAARKRASGQLRKLLAPAARFLHPAKPVLRNLASIPLTVAGFCCFDVAAVIWDPLVGIASAGVLLIVLEHLIADEA